MQVTLNKQTVELLKIFMKDDLDATDINEVANMAISVGIAQIGFNQGVLSAIQERYPKFSLSVPEVTPETKAMPIPVVCPDCEKKVIRRSDGKLICNCRVWG